MPIHDRRVALVSNSLAGKGKAIAVTAAVAEQLTKQSIIFSVFSDEWPSSFAGFTDVFIVGGDGTLNYFINHYPDLFLPLTVFKGGTGNDFAWKLYGGIQVKDQVQYALQTTPKTVDAGICNGRYFINAAGIGFDGEVVQSMQAKRFVAGRQSSYTLTALRKILFYREKSLQLEYDNQVKKDSFMLVSIANGSRCGNGFMVAPQAIITDGLLDVVTIGKISRLKRLFVMVQVQKGLHLKYPFVTATRLKKITVRADEPVAAHIDGEFMRERTFNIEILPKKFLFRF